MLFCWQFLDGPGKTAAVPDDDRGRPLQSAGGPLQGNSVGDAKAADPAVLAQSFPTQTHVTASAGGAELDVTAAGMMTTEIPAGAIHLELGPANPSERPRQSPLADTTVTSVLKAKVGSGEVAGSAIPFQKVTLVWKDLKYILPNPAFAAASSKQKNATIAVAGGDGHTSSASPPKDLVLLQVRSIREPNYTLTRLLHSAV